MKTAMEVAKFQRKLNRDQEEQKLKEMTSKGLTVIRDVDRKSFAKSMEPAFATWYQDYGKANIDNIINTKARAQK